MYEDQVIMDGKDEVVIRSSKIYTSKEAAANEADAELFKKSTCKISWQTPISTNFGTGFLCQFECSNLTLEGLFTCCHVVNCLENFLVEFEYNSFCLPVDKNDVKWIYTNKDLDVTFIVFKDGIHTMMNSKGAFLPVDKEYHQRIPPMSKILTIPQHPDGGVLSFSQGIVLACKNKKIFYECSTKGGSSGAPVLNDKSQVVAIHQKGGPIPEVSSKYQLLQYNIGTLMSHVIEAISTACPWNDPKWKPYGDDKPSSPRDTSLTPIGNHHLGVSSLCHLTIIKDKVTHDGNGFLCDLTIKNGVTVCGLFTNKHVILSKPDSLISFILHFVSDNSKVNMKSSDLAWVHVDSRLHFTFMAFTTTFAEEMRKQKREFLALAEKQPSNGSKFFLIQHVKDSKNMVFEGVLHECFNKSLCIKGSDKPRIHGSLILNEASKVIAIGNTCGLSTQIATLITQDTLPENLKSTYECKTYSECTLITNVTDRNILQSAAAVCKITTNDDGFLTGFLCCVPCGKSGTLKGLLTNYHGISHKQNFNVHFDKGNVDLTVERSDIHIFISDKDLEFTFITFNENILNQLTSNRLHFLSLINEQPTDSSILLLHHPEGNAASLSHGILTKDEDKDLCHISYTSFGSAGAPILNSNQKVIGIHKGTGPCDETAQALYKIGTKIVDVRESISKKRLNITV